MSQVLQMFDGQERYSSSTTVIPLYSKDQILSSSSTEYACARARPRDDDEEMLEIQEAFEDVFACAMKRKHMYDCQNFMRKGLSAAVIMNAIWDTADAPNPSWRYTCAILYRLIEAEIYTLDEYEQDKEAFRERMARRAFNKESREMGLNIRLKGAQNHD